MREQISQLVVAANVGVMLFFTVAVAPGIFKVLPAEWAARYVRSFFPKYYLALGLTTAIAAGLLPPGWVRTGLVACAVVFFVSRFWLTPQINRARDGGHTGRFHALHYASVGLNVIQLGVFVWILIAAVGRP